MDGDGGVDRYVHHKFFTIDGHYAGNPAAKFVFTGSANFANNALRYNNEVMLRIAGAAAHDAYATHFGALKAFAKTGTAVPARVGTTIGTDGVGATAGVPGASGVSGVTDAAVERLGPGAD
jgi:phosphatidylserine/phosphatidylglycerophosphate/cardiolipin synthase-like enzyme